MEQYVAARPDIFFVGRDGSLRSNRAFCQAAGHYACDLFIGSTLQIDLAGNSSTATKGRIAGFGGAPNLGGNATGGVTRRRRGCAPGVRRTRTQASRAGRSWWPRLWRPLARRRSLPSWSGLMPGIWRHRQRWNYRR